MFWMVDVKSRGIYNNVIEGIRLFLFKKSAFRFGANCAKLSCDIKIYPLMHISGDCFCQKQVTDKNGYYSVPIEYHITELSKGR